MGFGALTLVSSFPVSMSGAFLEYNQARAKSRAVIWLQKGSYRNIESMLALQLKSGIRSLHWQRALLLFKFHSSSLSLADLSVLFHRCHARYLTGLPAYEFRTCNGDVFADFCSFARQWQELHSLCLQQEAFKIRELGSSGFFVTALAEYSRNCRGQACSFRHSRKQSLPSRRQRAAGTSSSTTLPRSENTWDASGAQNFKA